LCLSGIHNRSFDTIDLDLACLTSSFPCDPLVMCHVQVPVIAAVGFEGWGCRESQLRHYLGVFVVYWYSFSNSCTVVRSLGFRLVRAVGGQICFGVLVPTPKVYRVPRVSPAVTAPKLFLPTSVAGYAGPSIFLTNHSRMSGTVYNYPRFRASSAWPQKGGAPRKAGDPHFVFGG
jgi:hypothetical protein